MIFNFQYSLEYETFQKSYPKSIVKLEDQPIENVETFRYLGDEIKFDEPGIGDAELSLRISIAESKFYEMIQKLTNHRIYLKTRVIILNAMVRSRLTYSCQTWNLNLTQLDQMNSTYVQMLRKLVKNGNKTEDYHYRYSNNDILQLCGTEDIHTYVARQQASYLGHLARQPNSSLTKRLLFNDNKRMKPGKPPETLEDKVIKDQQCTKDLYALKRRRNGHDRTATSDRLQSSQR